MNTIPMYASRMDKAVQGQLYGTTQWVVDGKIAGEEIEFGSPLFVQDDDGHVVKATGTAKNFAGVAGFETNFAGCYVEGSSVNCVRQGYIYVKMNSAIKEDEAVFVKLSDGTFVSETVAGSSADYVAVNGYAVEEGVAVGDIVAIYIN